MKALHFALIVFSFSQFFIAMLLLAKHWKASEQIRITVMLIACSCAYVLKQTHTPDMIFSFFWWFTFIGANSLLSCFWLLSLSLMGDKQAIARKHVAIAALPLVLPLLGELIHHISGFDIRVDAQWVWLFRYVAMIIELSFISHAVYIAVGHWQTDLVELRRKWRVGVVSICAIYIAFVIFTTQIIGAEQGWVVMVELMGLSLLAVIFNFSTFSLKDMSVFQIDKKNKIDNDKTDFEDIELFNQKHIDSIIKAMEEEKLYRQEGYTITDLSKHLLLQEYKVRKIINSKLNYRNFNDFLNYYRINEATKMLSSSEFIGVPVVSIAMESGFKAISSFNKTFREKHGVTPSAYRKQVFKESEKT
jgi:AraC-like DNA-binding protein